MSVSAYNIPCKEGSEEVADKKKMRGQGRKQNRQEAQNRGKPRTGKNSPQWDRDSESSSNADDSASYSKSDCIEQIKENISRTARFLSTEASLPCATCESAGTLCHLCRTEVILANFRLSLIISASGPSSIYQV